MGIDKFNSYNYLDSYLWWNILVVRKNNMWPFSYFKKRKEEKIKRAQEELRLVEEDKQKAIAERKALYNKYKSYIDEIIQTHNEDQCQKRFEYIDKKEQDNKKSNHICPRCKSNEVIEVFGRQKGELKGSFNSSSSSSYSHSLFSGYSSSSHSSSGNIDGSLDTFKVNRCSECGHEWEKLPECVYLSEKDYFPGKEDWDSYVTCFIDRVPRLIDEINRFDPNRLDNEFNSVDEIVENSKSYTWYQLVKDLPLELLYYIAYQNKYYINRKEEVFAKYNYNDGGQDYLGSFEPKFEAFLIEHFGFKKHFE